VATSVLACHPATPTRVVRTLSVDVVRPSPAELRLAYVLAGDVARLRVPAPAAPRRGTDLWRHTCFEAFVRAEDAVAYHELNLAPSGEWAVLAFRDYRVPDDTPRLGDDGLPPAIALPPRVAVRVGPDRIELDATVALDALAPEYTATALSIALATVVEETSGTRSYWALRHPAGAPDFHHRDAFGLRVEPPGAAC